jgi:hypothetical protein
MQYPTPWVLIQKSRILLKIWTPLFEKVVLPVAVAMAVAVAVELLLQQSDSDPLSNLQLYELLPLTYQDSNYPFERDIGYF